MSSQRRQHEKENTRRDHCAAVRKEDFLHAVFATTFTREIFLLRRSRVTLVWWPDARLMSFFS
jgi:hypothetical protein